jgi:RimJ/RimL family protein N-acetyltransferase
MRVLLQTSRLLLREFTLADVGNLTELDSDPEVMRLLTNGRPTPREVIENETLPRILRCYQDLAGRGWWAAVERLTGEFVGWFGLMPLDGGDSGDAVLGYRLRRTAWGKGYATEGSRALIRKAFTELGVRRVSAQTMAVNLASRRVMEKAGLTYARTFHLSWDDPIDGTELGEVEYELLKAEWESRNPARPCS